MIRVTRGWSKGEEPGRFVTLGGRNQESFTTKDTKMHEAEPEVQDFQRWKVFLRRTAVIAPPRQETATKSSRAPNMLPIITKASPCGFLNCWIMARASGSDVRAAA